MNRFAKMIIQLILVPIITYVSFRAFPKRAFRVVSTFCSPLARLYIKYRISSGLEDKNRKEERFGIPSEKRPEGKLIWIHAVSVGETISVIPIIKMIKERDPDINVLLTTTTLTAAKQVKERLSGDVIHQFIPFDIFMWVRRFVKYWKPNVVCFVESELWPNTLYYLREKDIPIYLLNVRMSKKSLKRMQWIQKVFDIEPFCLFTKIFVPTRELKDSVKNLGAKDVQIIPNLKTISSKLPVNIENKDKLIYKLKGRKAWIAVSTHSGEEKLIIENHKKLQEKYPDILTIIALRHPDRKDEVLALCQKEGVSAVLYTDSFESQPGFIEEEIFILNKMGCLGDFFEVIDIVVVCGSLIPGIGGHNFLEPLQFACNVATGKYIDNFDDIFSYVENYCKILKNDLDMYNFVNDSIENYSKDYEMMQKLNFAEQWKKEIYSIINSI